MFLYLNKHRRNRKPAECHAKKQALNLGTKMPNLSISG